MSNGAMLTIIGVVFVVQAAISIRWGGKVAALAFAAPYLLVVSFLCAVFGYFALRDGFKSVWPSQAEGIVFGLALCGFWTPFGVTAACVGVAGRAVTSASFRSPPPALSTKC